MEFRKNKLFTVYILVMTSFALLFIYSYLNPRFISCDKESLCTYYSQNKISGKKKPLTTFDGEYTTYHCRKTSTCSSGRRCRYVYELKLHSRGKEILERKFQYRETCDEYGRFYVEKIKKGNTTFEIK